MPGTELATAPRSTAVSVPMTGGTLEIIDVWRGYYEIAEAICRTDFVPKGLRNNAAAVAAAMLTGRELGLPEMAALSLIYVFEGRPGIYAEGMRALVQSHGHEIWVDDNEYTASKVTLFGQRAGSNKVAKVSWTMDMAKTANLAGKETYRKHPRQMLLARATGELCRLMFADVLRGVSYTVEELEDGLIEADDPGAGDPPTGEPAKAITRKASPARKTAAKKAPASASAAGEPPLPPLPGEDDEPVSGSSTVPDVAETGSDDPNVKERSKSIAIACQRAGLDDDGRHHLIEAMTNGRVSSSKQVTAEEGADVLQAAREIANGRARLIEGDDGWELAVDFSAEDDGQGDPVEDATGDEVEVEGVEAGWGSDEWRRFLSERGLKTVDTIREAQRVAQELGVEPLPDSLAKLKGQAVLCARVRAWAEEQTAT